MTVTLTTRADLDQLHCDEPGCEGCDELNPGLVLYPRCHPDVLTIPLSFEGELHLECAECGEVYLAVPVAG